jgi:hypothetical protein
LVVILNANQSGGGAITVNQLVLTIYDPAGAVKFTAAFNGGPLNISATDTGQGSLGFGFRLSGTVGDNEIAAANPFITCPTCGGNLIGLSVILSNANGANETLSALFLTPEPTTLLMFLSGLGAVLLVRRWRRVRA